MTTMASRRRFLPATIAAVCVLPLSAAPLPGHAAGPPAFPPDRVLTSAAAPSPPDDRGSWRSSTTAGGKVISWTSPTPLPVTDARPEFRVNGSVIGYPTVNASGRVLSLATSAEALSGVDNLADIEVWFSGRRLDLVGTPPAGKTSPMTGQSPVGKTVTPKVDPGKAGSHPVTSFDYRSAAIAWREFTSPMEVLGHAVLPTDVDNAPLVLILHGRHSPCYGFEKAGGAEPCPDGGRPVPSYLGYDYLQQMLASQGYATVSISSNVINSEDYKSPDGGSAARSALIRHHLRLLTQWTADPSRPRWLQAFDPSRVVLIGHSRGGEGVNQAVIDARTTAPFDIDGQVLIAPVDFSYQTAAYTPTVTFLPYCDGDVFDLQGQRYVDAAQTLTPDDPSLRSSILMRGANHNFFNTEWTPGISEAPSFDDWFDQDHKLCGRDASPTRLTAGEQRRMAKTFVAASVHAMLDGDQGSIDVIDAGRPVQLPQAGDAVAWTHAIGGNRTTVRLGDGATRTGTATACRSGKVGSAFKRVTLPLCGLPSNYARQVHWTAARQSYYPDPQPAFAHFGLTRRLSFDWTAPDQVGGMTLAPPLDASSTGASLDLRVLADPTHRGARVVFRLSDGTASWTSRARAINPFAGNSFLRPIWARTVRLDLSAAATTLDLHNLQTIELVSRSDTGKVWLLDASVRRPGAQPVPEQRLPNITMGAVTVTEGDAAGTRTANVPFRVVGHLSQPAKFAVSYSTSSFDSGQRPQYAEVTVQPGDTGGSVLVPFSSNNRDDEDRVRITVLAVSLSNIEMSDYHGRLTVLDDDPTPSLSLSPREAPVHYGDPIVYEARLSALSNRFIVFQLRGVVTQLPQLRTSALTRRFIENHEGDVRGQTPPDGIAARFIRTYIGISPGDTSVTFSVPTKAKPLHPGRYSLTLQAERKVLGINDRATGWVR